ncbi:hypothetical protein B7P33_06970 [Sediminicola luteus]|uniref:DNA-binding response regulator n=2 Tax=Sediminicola luteus TaxID=319238 RepID=A0A2A4GAA1_9FLAO|nr:hypothetical protein B7P33_06970 [Sediminicola luteus]
MINCLVIDDEPAAQTVLTHYLEELPSCHLVGCCPTALKALPYLEAQPKIDLLFLDINLPKLSGMDFYRSLKNPPEVIFTTAYPNFAVEAFEVNALDYLVKPIAFERFLSAVNKFQEKHKDDNQGYIFINSNKTLHRLKSLDILAIEAQGDYVKVITRNAKLLTHSTFSSFLDELPDYFLRCHKSFALNSKKLDRISGNKAIVGPLELPIGLTYKEDFLEKLGA